MLTSSNKELEILCNGDERVKRYKDRVEELNDDPEYTILMSDEEDDKKLKATREYLEKLRAQEHNERMKKLDDKEKTLDSKERILDDKERTLDSKEKALNDKEKALDDKMAKLAKLEKEVEEKSKKLREKI